MRETILIASASWRHLQQSVGYIVLAFISSSTASSSTHRPWANRRRPAPMSSFFEVCFGTTVVAAILLTMRLIAEERQRGTHLLLDSSPVSRHPAGARKVLECLRVSDHSGPAQPLHARSHFRERQGLHRTHRHRLPRMSVGVASSPSGLLARWVAISLKRLRFQASWCWSFC